MQQDIIGHEDILLFFDKVITNRALHHAYCFSGRTHLGKMTVTTNIARVLLGVAKDKPLVHPDMLIVAQEKNEKTGKTKKHIDVQQIQQVRTFATGKPLVAEKKIAIIDGAENMNVSSSNALLKTLEEPSGHTTIFLITRDETALLDTIQSRCHTIFFHPVNTQKIEAFLHKKNIGEAKDIAEESHGVPGLAVRWAEDSEQFSAYKQQKEQFKTLIGKPLYEKIHIVESLFGNKTDHIAQRNTIKNTLDVWQMALREESITWTPGTITDTYEQIVQAKKGLTKNIHPRLLIEHVLLTIP